LARLDVVDADAFAPGPLLQHTRRVSTVYAQQPRDDGA